MTVTAPPEPPREDLEALIEEARRRARRRRFGYAALVVAALALGAAGYGIVRGGSGGRETGERSPVQFTSVRARGPVAHALVETRGGAVRTFHVDLATGAVRPARVTREVWWDRAGGLARVVEAVDGRTRLDLVGRQCRRGFCFAPPPFDLAQKGIRWPIDGRRIAPAGTGTIDGRPVVWVDVLTNGRKLTRGAERAAFDARTHEPVAYRLNGPGRTFDEDQRIQMLKTIPARSFSFDVPKGGLPTSAICWPPCWPASTVFSGSGVDAARSALGTAPLWLGETFAGSRLRSVRAGELRLTNARGTRISAVPVVRVDYGRYTIDEFTQPPFWYETPPPPGSMIVELGGPAFLAHDDLFVVLSIQRPPLTPRRAASLARALRPAAS